MKPGGLLSLILPNQYSLPYQAAFQNGNLDEAYELLDQKQQHSSVFGVDIHEFRADELIAWLEQKGYRVKKHYGIRCMYNYWGTNEQKQSSAVNEKLKRLEMELTERHPYNLTARQFQLIARKN